jgi:hypothetical protein
VQRRSFSWVALLGVGLAGVVAVSAATALPARSTASAFELTLEATWYDGPWVFSPQGGTFRSRAPFCATGTFVEGYVRSDGRGWWFRCDDGTGSLAVSISQDNTTWRIRDGSGSYSDLRGSGSLRGESLPCESCDPESGSPWRGSLQGVVDRDAIAPSIDISSATATKLSRPAAYSIKIALALRDDVEENPVAYKLRVTDRRGVELASKEGTTASGSVSMTLRVVPSSKRIRSVQLRLSGSDPIGNEVSLARSLKLPRP